MALFCVFVSLSDAWLSRRREPSHLLLHLFCFSVSSDVLETCGWERYAAVPFQIPVGVFDSAPGLDGVAADRLGAAGTPRPFPRTFRSLTSTGTSCPLHRPFTHARSVSSLGNSGSLSVLSFQIHQPLS